MRIPVQNCHSLSVNIEFEQSFDLDKLIQKLKSDTNQTALKIYDMPGFPTPLETTGKDFTGVGRIRVDPSVPFGLSLFIVSDNLRTGAALNSVKIAEYVCKD